MQIRTLTIVLIGAVLVVVGVFIVMSKRSSAEPRFIGESLRGYIEQINSPMDTVAQREAANAAATAVRQLGEPAVDWLSQRLERKESVWQRCYHVIWKVSPAVCQKWMSAPSKAPNPGAGAESLLENRILRVLVHTGPAAIPVLTNYLNASIYGQSTREDIYRALMSPPLSHSAREALPMLEHSLNGTNTLDRLESAMAIARIEPERTAEVVSVLRAALISSDQRVMAADYLGNLRHEAEVAIPDLEAAMGDSDPAVAERARVALRKVSGKPVAKK